MSGQFYYPKHDTAGNALVIGNGNYGDVQKSCTRDADAMVNILKKIGFDVIYLQNVSSGEILETTRKLRLMDHSEASSFLMYFSGHGSKNVIYGNGSEDAVEIIEIVEMFQPDRCKSLSGKPKIFLWDCCRGELKSKAFESEDSDFLAPSFCDFVYGYSTALNHQAYIGSLGDTDGLSIWTYFLQKHLKNILQLCILLIY
eukprot:TRINITY_DN1890_c0_g1_i1.p1 TRINITY_DN1890_c0_g1~~TRINITY_DN1890_c0_g1_i1.p1  ORF type:complete len:216 (-),score=38.05 TRINITY_DN1890_c0_g1_i1:241-840(-)